MPAASGLSCALFLIRLTTMPERLHTSDPPDLAFAARLVGRLRVQRCRHTGLGAARRKCGAVGRSRQAGRGRCGIPAPCRNRQSCGQRALFPARRRALRENGDYAGAQRAIADIRRKRLQGEDLVRFDLLDAEIALNAGDADRASALLAMPPGWPVATAARAPAGTGTRSRCQPGSFRCGENPRQSDALAGADRDINRRQILEVLTKLDPDSLKGKGNVAATGRCPAAMD